MAGETALLVCRVSEGAEPFPHQCLKAKASKPPPQGQRRAIAVVAMLAHERLNRTEYRRPLSGTFVTLLFALRFTGRCIGNHAGAAIGKLPGAARIDAALQRIVRPVLDPNGGPIQAMAEQGHVVRPALVF